MKKARWIVQKNLLHENDLNQIKKACDSIGVPYHGVLVVPFDKNLPSFPIGNGYENIYYGSTTFMENLYKASNPRGLFYNENFSIENYCKQWGEHMLNYDAKFMTINEFFSTNEYQYDQQIFIRPDSDGKQFDGQVAKYKNAQTFLKRHLEYDSSLSLDSKIVVGQPYNILREWRCIVVDGEIVTQSMYRKNFRLHKSVSEIPESMLYYVEARILEYQPHDVFAIDIAEVNDDGEPRYYIIECGCANSVGFYLCDIKKIITSITKYIEK